ncbi:hypothetical protein OG275_00305 [Streptomyces niveus]|uniref:hypothetical protein n=1 Tax=Streptomyces niveus TaxID=193462 RepID=UPI002E3205BD|nr:hypothetical protein [Streptomyces niveus]
MGITEAKHTRKKEVVTDETAAVIKAVQEREISACRETRLPEFLSWSKISSKGHSMRRPSRPTQNATGIYVRRFLAGTALLAASSVLSTLITTVPASATIGVADEEDTGLYRSSIGEEPRLLRCTAGVALHIGGPALKAKAIEGLKGTNARLAAIVGSPSHWNELSAAAGGDKELADQYIDRSDARHKGWEDSNRVYAKSSYDGEVDLHAPRFDAPVRDFTEGGYLRVASKLGEDGHAPPSEKALRRAAEIADENRGKDVDNDFIIDGILRDGASPYYRQTTSSDIAAYLRRGGFPATAPAEGSPEFRVEVEYLKNAWGACDSLNPVDFDRVLNPVLVTASAEWEAEYAAQATQRNTIIEAEAAAAAEAKKATDEMVGAIGQAWLAEQILLWQKEWASKPANDILRPKPEVFTQANLDLKLAQRAASFGSTRAGLAVRNAGAAVTRVAAAQKSAYELADGLGAPRGRGLVYAQQSAQVVKASYAAAQAAAKAAETASNAASATVSDSKALFALSQTQSHAVNTEFRKAAALEAAAQAKAAATAAGVQAKEAAANATKAKTAQTTAENAEKTAKAAAATAKTERAKAEKEKANATSERKTADSERAKAGAANERAQSERETAGRALSSAQTSAETASEKRTDAEAAEHRAYLARDKAEAAERRKDSSASRARALEAAAAAAEGTDAAAAARQAATEARTAANDAAGAATRARTAANEASSAAVNARAAATRADGAASRARASADRAWSAYQTSYAAAQTAHAAAAEAIDASEAASTNARTAEAEAKKAQAASLKAHQEALAAKDEAAKTAAWSAKTAGFAFAAAESAAAARDSAAEVIKPANTAIAIGTPFRETDSAAAFAVLVGQISKPLADQQAAAATSKGVEAAQAAAAAKLLAEKAAGDAKIAAQAAADAAADTAKALKSAADARASATAAATSAAAAKKADTNTTAYNTQAGTDALYANSAAGDAEGQAAAANAAASDAEKDAGSARTAATAAEKDATTADNTATQAEKDATAAETAASNADTAAKEADEAATRAEAEARKRAAAEYAAWAKSGREDTTGPDLSTDEEALLREHCGQQCVDDFRAAKKLAAVHVIDWIKENGGDILLEVFGIDNMVNCVSTRDIETCLWALFDLASVAIGILKAPKVIKAIDNVAGGIDAFYESSKTAKRAVERYRDLIARLKKEKEHPSPNPPCTEPLSVGAAATARTVQAASAEKNPCNWKLPPGVGVPVLDEWAITGIRGSHFPGGSKVDSSKGLFKGTVTNEDLQKIFEAGMEDAAPFKANKDFYYEKEFNYSDVVGFTSGDSGAVPTNRVILVISKYESVVNMFPAT